jgi:integrase
LGELLAIKKVDLNLDRGELLTRWDDTKGDRDEVVPLHPVVVEHLRPLVGGANPLIFPWANDPRTLWVEFGRIQEAVGLHLPCREPHDHTAACHVYGIHDFRRAFATVNAARLKPEVLQRLMRHKSYQTTQKFYINPTSQMQDAVTDMPIPDALRKKQGGQTDVPPEDGEK